MMILVACLWREGDKLIIQSIIHFSIEGNFGKVLTDFVCFVLQQSRDLNLMSAQEKQMEVCEVCGAFLIIGDAQTRVDDHLQGKQHMGYAKIKSTIEELKVSWAILALCPSGASKIIIPPLH